MPPTDSSADDTMVCATRSQCSSLDLGECVHGDCINGHCVAVAGPCGPAQSPCMRSTCNATTGVCDIGDDDGAVCDDGVRCTFDDRCRTGACVGEQTVCPNSADPCMPNVCNEDTGTCRPEQAPATTGCHDGDPCTIEDHCFLGSCRGEPVVCVPADVCHVAGECESESGVCSTLPAPRDTACDVGGDPGFCRAGLCGRRVFAAGPRNTCVVTEGNVRCWGANDFGQLGAPGPTVGDDDPANAAPLLDFINDATSVSVGYDFVCAGFADGKLRCWGKGHSGQLGNGTTEDQPDALTAPDVSLDGQFTSVYAGVDYACAIRVDGKLWCWGANASGGRLGYPSLPSNAVLANPGLADPIVFGGERRPASLALGYFHVCAVLDPASVPGSENNLVCWGANGDGALGYGDEQSRPDPSAVELVHVSGTVVEASAGLGFATCVRLADGRVKCWGLNDAGMLGIGAGIGDVLALAEPPVAAVFAGASSLSASATHVCVVGPAKGVWCWGNGAKIGIEGASQQSAPLEAPIALGDSAIAVSSNGGHTCATTSSGGVRCWGFGVDGALGYGSTVDVGSAAGTMPPPDVPWE